MTRFRIFFIFILLLVSIFFLKREFQTRRIFWFEGEILPCEYRDARSYCSFLLTRDGQKLLLTPASEEKISQYLRLSVIYGREVKLKGSVLGEKIGVLNEGELNRFKVDKFEFF